MASELTVRDVALRLGKGERTIVNMLKAGQLKGDKRGKQWMIKVEENESLLGGAGHPSSATNPALPGRDALVAQQALRGIKDNVKDLESALQGSLQQASLLLAGAQDTGIEAIYAPRRSSAQTNGAIEMLLREAKDEILLMGVSLRQFFGDKYFRQTLWDRLAADPAIHVRALLINPFSTAAKARMRVEGAVPRKADDVDLQQQQSGLFKDLETSVGTIQRFREELQGRKSSSQMEARFYDCTPFAFFMLTGDGLVIEQYHFGRQPSPVGGCIGELMPLLRFGPRSAAYELMKNSFNHLWNGDNDSIGLTPLESIAASLRRAYQGRPRTKHPLKPARSKTVGR